MAGHGTTGRASGKTRTRRLFLFLFLVIFAFGCRKENAHPTAPQEVQIITLAPTNVPIMQEWIGTLDGYVNAQIRAQVSGYLLTQNYAEGSQVTKGDLLFRIDPRPFQAALDEAKARLAQNEALVEKTRLDVERFTPLAKTRALSQQDLDKDRKSTRLNSSHLGISYA